jgi:bacterial/archaeal transporter family-2 protein
MFFILISITAGAIVVISRILNTRLSEKTSLMESSFFNYLTGLLSSFILFAAINDNITLSGFHNIPFWAYLGGILGVFVVTLSSVVTPKMSTFYITLIIFIGQIFAGIIIDCILLKTIPFAKIIGGLIVVAGLAYNLQVDSTVNLTSPDIN